RIRSPLLRRALAFADWASANTFRRGHAAPNFADSDVVPPEKFPFNSYDMDEPDLDLDRWSLEVSGQVERPGAYTLAQIRSLPRVQQNTRHVGVEGWDVVGNFGGARLADFLAHVGAAPDARFVAVECADDYYESIDMAAAMHPMSLLCYKMWGQPLSRGH